MRVLEAGAGSGALTCSLLRAVGERGSVTSYERREDFADVAAPTSAPSSARCRPTWSLRLGDLDQHPAGEVVDRVVWTCSSPWAVLPTVAAGAAPGGVLVGYVATTTQLSTYVEALPRAGRVDRAARLGDPARPWQPRGLRVRPEHPDGRATPPPSLVPLNCPAAGRRRRRRAAAPAPGQEAA
jgi:tRNA (adenine57-N1/adenine58-N1)-methyltransferase